MHKYFLKIFLILELCLLTLWASCGWGDRGEQRNLAKKVGVQLCELAIVDKLAQDTNCETMNTNITNPAFISVPSELRTKLAEVSPEIWQDYEVDVYEKDSSNGDGSATHFIIIKSKENELLGVRLKFNPKVKKFEILGFWTIYN